MTDHNEAMRLAEWHTEQAHGWRNAASHSAADNVEPVRSSLLAKAAFHDQAAALLHQQAERIAELEADYQRLMDKHNALHVNALKDRTERDTLRAEAMRLAERIAELEARVHTCGPTCSKAGCVNRRITAERDTLLAEVESMGKAISDFCDGAWWAVDAWKNRPDIKPLFDIDAARKEAT